MQKNNEEYTSRLRASVMLLLRPLVRILLRSGVGFSDFAEWVKFAYVDVAEKEFALDKRSQSTSRVSILTGMHRKEVARIRKEISEGTEPIKTTSANRADRVINAWMREENYTDENDAPIDLPFTSESEEACSFSSLVREFSGDIHSMTLFEELLRIGAVEKMDNGLLRLKSSGYIPETESLEQLDIAGQSAHDLLSTLSHNLQAGQDNKYYQRSVAYRHLSKASVHKFKHYSEQENQKLLIKLNKWLAQHDMKIAEQKKEPCQYRVGVGVYYFEEQSG